MISTCVVCSGEVGHGQWIGRCVACNSSVGHLSCMRQHNNISCPHCEAMLGFFTDTYHQNVVVRCLMHIVKWMVGALPETYHD